MSSYVLDTSAVLCYMQNEPQADQIEALIMAARTDPLVELSLPFIVLMEVEYKFLKLWRNPTRVDAVVAALGAWPATVRESSETWRREAARVKASNRLSVADAWVASLGLLLDAAVVHKDPEMDAVPGLKAMRL